MRAFCLLGKGILVNAAEETQDAELISRVRAGDRGAFGCLFERHHESALRVAEKITYGTRLSAEDCVSEAFAQILSVLQRGKGPDEFFRAYLYTVMRNLVKDGTRSDSHSLTVDDFDLVEKLSREENLDPAITRFETEVVRTAYASLPERWQAVLWYADIEEMKPAEIAPILGLSAHGVSMLRTRAREGLRTAYLQSHLSVVTPGTTCAQTSSKLGAFSRMTLAKRDRVKVEAHLSDCPDCRAMSSEVRNINRGLLAIIALLFLGGSSREIFGGAGRGIGPSTSAAVLKKAASGLAYRPGRSIAVVGAAASVSLALGLFSASGGFESQPGSARELLEEQPSMQEIVLQPLREEGESGGGIVDEQGEGDSRSDDASQDENVEAALPEVPRVDPPVPPQVNLLGNGGFDGPGLTDVLGQFQNGDVFDGWNVRQPSGPDPTLQTMKVWYEGLGEPTISYAAPFSHGPWPRIMGSISQSFPTEVGKTYLLEYQTRASGSDANGWAAGWAGGNPGYAAINGTRIDSFVTVASPVYSQRAVQFVATTATTELSLGNSAGGAIGVDNVSVTLVH